MEANPRDGEGESWWLGLSPGFNHSLKVPNPMTQLILFSLYFRLSWNSFPFILKRSKTNTKFFLMSSYIIQQLAYTQPSALGYFGYTAYIYILWLLGKLSASEPCVPYPLASPELSPQNLGVSPSGQRKADHWNPYLGFREARGSEILSRYVEAVSCGK